MNNGNTCVCLSPAGNFPILYVVLIRFEIVPLTFEKHDFRIFAEIFSTSDCFMFKLEIALCIYVSVVGLNENWSSGLSRGLFSSTFSILVSRMVREILIIFGSVILYIFCNIYKVIVEYIEDI